jgi:hypothetical protein
MLRTGDARSHPLMPDLIAYRRARGRKYSIWSMQRSSSGSFIVTGIDSAIGVVRAGIQRTIARSSDDKKPAEPIATRVLEYCSG